MYQHTVQYYETDKMSITHHSNYVRWMEEARVDYLKRLGYSLVRLEELGIVSPVVSLNCRYKKTTTFADVIRIDIRITEFKGVKLQLSYTFYNEKDEIVFTAQSEHCFITAEGRPLRLKKEFPDFYEALLSEYEKCATQN